jgi:hypothetical protein
VRLTSRSSFQSTAGRGQRQFLLLLFLPHRVGFDGLGPLAGAGEHRPFRISVVVDANARELVDVERWSRGRFCAEIVVSEPAVATTISSL